MGTLDQVVEIVQYLPNDLAFKVVFKEINSFDMAKVVTMLKKEWGFKS